MVTFWSRSGPRKLERALLDSNQWPSASEGEWHGRCRVKPRARSVLEVARNGSIGHNLVTAPSGAALRGEDPLRGEEKSHG